MVAPVAAAGLAAVTSLFGSSRERRHERRQRRAQQKQFGVNAAGIDFSQARQLTFIPEQVKGIQEGTTLAKLSVDRAQARTEAELRVNAAAAGVEGDSVNQIIGETEVNAANAKEIIDSQEKNAQNQQKQNFVDTTVNASQQTGQLDTSTRDQTLQHALSFATGFKDSFVPTSELEGNE